MCNACHTILNSWSTCFEVKDFVERERESGDWGLSGSLVLTENWIQEISL
jgi:hypothetical protein